MRTTLTTITVAALVFGARASAQVAVTETRDPRQQQDPDFARAYAQWTTEPRYGSPLVDHLPRVAGIPMPKDILGYHIGRCRHQARSSSTGRTRSACE